MFKGNIKMDLTEGSFQNVWHWVELQQDNIQWPALVEAYVLLVGYPMITVAAWSKARKVFSRSNAEILGSDSNV
jgi:hypothetical protein